MQIRDMLAIAHGMGGETTYIYISVQLMVKDKR